MLLGCADPLVVQVAAAAARCDNDLHSENLTFEMQ